MRAAAAPSAPAFSFAGASAAAPASAPSLFGGSGFGAPAFGGAASAPAFGAPASSSALSFGGASTPAFGATSAPAFGAAASAPAFGGFGGAPAPAFGASSSAFNFASSTPAFGAASSPAFGGGFGGQGGGAFGAPSSFFGAAAQPQAQLQTQLAPASFASGGQLHGCWVACAGYYAAKHGVYFRARGKQPACVQGCRRSLTWRPLKSWRRSGRPTRRRRPTRAAASATCSSTWSTTPPPASNPLVRPLPSQALLANRDVGLYGQPGVMSHPKAGHRNVLCTLKRGMGAWSVSDRTCAPGVDELKWREALQKAGGANNASRLWPVQALGPKDLLARKEAQVLDPNTAQFMRKPHRTPGLERVVCGCVAAV